MADVMFVLVTVLGFVALALVVRGGGAAVSATNGIGLAVAVVLAVFLVCALLFPERF